VATVQDMSPEPLFGLLTHRRTNKQTDTFLYLRIRPTLFHLMTSTFVHCHVNEAKYLHDIESYIDIVYDTYGVHDLYT